MTCSRRRRSKKSGTPVASSVLRDSSSGDDVVRDCSGEVCADVVKDEGGTHQREMVVDSRTSLSAARIDDLRVSQEEKSLIQPQGFVDTTTSPSPSYPPGDKV